jgi:glycosyltransferase involved in cell wall biosynthesis
MWKGMQGWEAADLTARGRRVPFLDRGDGPDKFRPSRSLGSPEVERASLLRANRVLRVSLCVITRNRLRMLEDLFDSFRFLQMPSNVRLSYVIVENNNVETVAEVVARFRDAVTPVPVLLALEPNLGIPIARNRACDVALEAGADVLVFVDDDEQVTPGWLVELIARYRTTDLMLIGGPVVPVFPPGETTRWGRSLQSGIAHRGRVKARKAEANMEAGRRTA